MELIVTTPTGPLVPLPITVSTIKITSEPEAGWVLTSDAEGNASWQSPGEPGPASDLIAPVTIFVDSGPPFQNAILTMNNETDAKIVPVNLSTGQILIGSTGAAPVKSTLTAGLNMAIINSPGHISVETTTNPTFGTMTADNIDAGVINSDTMTADTVNTESLNANSAFLTGTIIADTVSSNTANIVNLNTTNFKLTASPSDGFILQSNSTGKGEWVTPSAAVNVTAGPSNNLIVTHPSTAPLVIQIDTVPGPSFTSLTTSGLAAFGQVSSPTVTATGSVVTPLIQLNSTPSNLHITCPLLGQNTSLQVEDMKNVNAAIVTSTRNTVTQTGTITSPVTINGTSGIITTIIGGIIRDDTNTAFTVNNSCVTASSVVIVTCTQPGFNPSGGGFIYTVSNVISGSFQINMQAVNISVLHIFSSTWKFTFLIC